MARGALLTVLVLSIAAEVWCTEPRLLCEYNSTCTFSAELSAPQETGAEGVVILGVEASSICGTQFCSFFRLDFFDKSGADEDFSKNLREFPTFLVQCDEMATAFVSVHEQESVRDVKRTLLRNALQLTSSPTVKVIKTAVGASLLQCDDDDLVDTTQLFDATVQHTLDGAQELDLQAQGQLVGQSLFGVLPAKFQATVNLDEGEDLDDLASDFSNSVKEVRQNGPVEDEVSEALSDLASDFTNSFRSQAEVDLQETDDDEDFLDEDESELGDDMDSDDGSVDEDLEDDDTEAEDEDNDDDDLLSSEEMLDRKFQRQGENVEDQAYQRYHDAFNRLKDIYKKADEIKRYQEDAMKANKKFEIMTDMEKRLVAGLRNNWGRFQEDGVATSHELSKYSYLTPKYQKLAKEANVLGALTQRKFDREGNMKKSMAAGKAALKKMKTSYDGVVLASKRGK